LKKPTASKVRSTGAVKTPVERTFSDCDF